MSAPPISGSDPEARAERLAREEAMARAAGWRGADLAFERLTEAGCAALHGGDLPAAIAAFGKARRLAFWRIARSDPRHATSLANAAMAARLAGREARARRLYAAARRRWAAVPGRVAAVEPARRARSSLFHLRMEARHWDTYVANQRKRLAGFVADADAALAALAESRRPPARLYTRWRGEKPPVFDEMRKLMSAALLIAAPPEDRPEDRLEA